LRKKPTVPEKSLSDEVTAVTLLARRPTMTHAGIVAMSLVRIASETLTRR
jgi:hypothetical protein